MEDERVSRVDVACLAAAGLAGIVARIWILRSPLGSLDSDEAVVGLMARHIAELDDFPVFFWGQHYGGTLEAVLTAVVFRIVGSGTLALKVVPLLLCATATLLAARLGTELLGRRRGLYGAAAFWIATGNYLWWSTKARLFYWSTLTLGLALLLLVLRLARDRDRDLDDKRLWLALGLVAGVGWWTSPQILFFVLPALAWAAVRLRSSLWRPLFLYSAPAAVVGALPWLYVNVRNGFPSFDYAQPVESSYSQHLEVFFERGMPVLLGLHALETWVVESVFPVLYVVVLALLVVALVRNRRRLGALALLVASYPFVFAVFPTSWVVGEGRYLLFLAPAVWLALASLPPTRWRAVLPLALPLIGALAIADLGVIKDKSLPLAVDVLVPNDDRDLRRLLDDEGVTRAYADYWVAYRTTFETDERVVVTPDIVEQVRYPPYTQTVRDAPDAARIFLAGSQRETAFRASLVGAEHCVRRVERGAYVVYRPVEGDFCASVAAAKLRT